MRRSRSFESCGDEFAVALAPVMFTYTAGLLLNRDVKSGVTAQELRVKMMMDVYLLADAAMEVRAIPLQRIRAKENG